MGQNFKIGCTNCNYEENLSIGIGMLYRPDLLLDFKSEMNPLPSIIGSKKTLEEIRKLTEKKDLTIYGEYGFDVYRCPQCNHFFERFTITLKHTDGLFRVEYECPTCKMKLEPILVNGQLEEENYDISKYPCPICGKYSLEQRFDELVMWD